MIPEYQQRVIDERSELDGKIGRLSDFVSSERFNTVKSDERCRMSAQLEIMRQYSKILGERIVGFGISVQ